MMIAIPLIGFIMAFALLVYMYNYKTHIEHIPKIIHQTAPSDKTKWKPVWFECQESWMKLHPDFEYRMWTDEDLDEFMKTEFPDFYENVFTKYDVNIKRIDSARYFILYKYGGIYADMDYKCQHRFFESLPKGVVSIARSQVEFDGGFQNALMISPKGHSYWKCVFDLLKERKDEPNVILATGPRIISDCAKVKYINGLSVMEYNPYFDHWHDSPDNYPEAMTIHTHTYSWSVEDYKTVHVTKSYVITTKSEKSKERIKLLSRNFSRYKMPHIELHYAIPGKDVDYSKFHPKIKNFLMETQISLSYAMYQVFEKIANGEDEWCYFFEDDAVIVNVKEGNDLTIIKGVPTNAEMIVFSRGVRNKIFDGTLTDIKPTYGGGNMHGQLINRQGAKKLLEALNPMWTAIDVNLYKCSCDWKKEEGYDLYRDNKHCEKIGDVKNEMIMPCIKMYESNYIFEQTSNPGRPKEYEDVRKYHELVIRGESDYAIHPLDWIEPSDYKEITLLK